MRGGLCQERPRGPRMPGPAFMFVSEGGLDLAGRDVPQLDASVAVAEARRSKGRNEELTATQPRRHAPLLSFQGDFR